MPTNILDFINGVENGDFVSAKATFDSIVSDKMSDAIAVERINVASKMYNGAVEMASEQEDVAVETSEE